MKKILSFLVSLFIIINANACLNYYVLDSAGVQHLQHYEKPSEILPSPQYHINRLNEIELELNSTTDSLKYKYATNYTSHLINLGRHKEALLILEKYIISHPNEYEINSNLAVAYELDGQLDKALSYLIKSLRINPESHSGSEWIHLKILQKQIQLKHKKINLDTANILHLQEIDIDNKLIHQHIAHQLNERIPLTPSDNEFLSKVLEECADYYYSKISVGWAMELYALSIAYTKDSFKQERFWTKINEARNKLLTLKKNKKYDKTVKNFYSKNWKNDIQKTIDKWSSYKPYYYDGEVLTNI